MSLRDPIHHVTERIRERSQPTRDAYLERIRSAGEAGPVPAGSAEETNHWGVLASGAQTPTHWVLLATTGPKSGALAVARRSGPASRCS